MRHDNKNKPIVTSPRVLSRRAHPKPASPVPSPLGEVPRSDVLVLDLVPITLIAGLFSPKLGIFAIGGNQGLMIAAFNDTARP